MNEQQAASAILVSVVIPVYNVATYLDECVRSVAEQTHERLEIVLVDDGSTDGGGALCDRWKALDGRVNVIHQSNQGLSAARNTGLDHAHGEYVVCVDSDDYIEPTLVERALDVSLRYDAPMTMYTYDCVNETGDKRWAPIEAGFFPSEPCLAADDVLGLLLTSRLTFFAWKFLAKRSLYELNGYDHIRFPVGRKYEDVATTYRLVAQAGRIAMLDEPLLHYRQREGSILHNRKEILPSYRDVTAITDDIVEYMRLRRPELVSLSETYRAIFFMRLAWGCLRDDDKPLDYRDALAYLRGELRRTAPVRVLLHMPWKQRVLFGMVRLGLFMERLTHHGRRHDEGKQGESL